MTRLSKGEVVSKYVSSTSKLGENGVGVLVGVATIGMGFLVKFLISLVLPSGGELGVLKLVYYISMFTYYTALGWGLFNILVAVLGYTYHLMTGIGTKEVRPNYKIEGNFFGKNRGEAYVRVEDYNKMVLVCDDTNTDMGMGIAEVEDVLEVRRLYTILGVNKDGEVYVTKGCRELTKEEGYKGRYCKDSALDLGGLLQLNNTFKLLQEDKQREYEIAQFKEKSEKRRAKLQAKQLTQKKYDELYDKKYGKTSEPEELLREKERLDKDIKLLSDELTYLTVDLVGLSKQVKDENKINIKGRG